MTSGSKVSMSASALSPLLEKRSEDEADVLLVVDDEHSAHGVKSLQARIGQNEGVCEVSTAPACKVCVGC
jgi:hypothetical protein